MRDITIDPFSHFGVETVLRFKFSPLSETISVTEVSTSVAQLSPSSGLLLPSFVSSRETLHVPSLTAAEREVFCKIIQ